MSARARLRVLLDVVDAIAAGHRRAPASATALSSIVRPSLSDIDISDDGRATLSATGSPAQLSTLCWEIAAGRRAEGDDLPWGDPAGDLPEDVLDVFASLSVRSATSVTDLVDRVRRSIGDRAGSREDVRRAQRGNAGLPTPVVPRDQNHVTARMPAVTAEALRAFQESEATLTPARVPLIDSGATLTPIDSTAASTPIEVPADAAAPSEPSRSDATPVPWLAPEPEDIEELPPKRRRTWPFVAVSLAAAMALIGVAVHRHRAERVEPAAPAHAEVAQVATAPIAPTQAAEPTPIPRNAQTTVAAAPAQVAPKRMPARPSPSVVSRPVSAPPASAALPADDPPPSPPAATPGPAPSPEQNPSIL